jgi:hypothetical protein
MPHQGHHGKPHGAKQQKYEANAVRIRRQVIVQRITTRRPMQFAKSSHHRNGQTEHEQVRAHTELQQRNVGHPGTETAPDVLHASRTRSMGEGGIGTAEAGEHREQRDRGNGADDPTGFGQQSPEAIVAFRPRCGVARTPPYAIGCALRAAIHFRLGRHSSDYRFRGQEDSSPPPGFDTVELALHRRALRCGAAPSKMRS